MTKDNDLVKRLRKRQEFEFIDGYKRIEWEDDDALEAADRIEALEAALEEMRELFFERMGAQKSHPLAWEYYTGEKSGDKP